MSRVQISSPAPFYFNRIYINVGVDKTIEIIAEMTILAAVMFLAAFFCFRVLLLPKTSATTMDKIHEVEEILSEKR